MRVRPVGASLIPCVSSLTIGSPKRRHGTGRYHAAGDGSGGSQWGKLDFQAIVEADEPVPAIRSVAERSLLLGSTDPRPARSPGHHVGATSGQLSPFFVAPVHQQTFD